MAQFEHLSLNSGLKTRYDNLKAWRKRAEVVSARASGTQEDDGPLRDLIQTLANDKEVSCPADMNFLSYF